MTLSTSLLANEPQVTTVYLANLELSNYTDTLVAMLPPNVQDLSLNNVILKAFPKNIGSLKALTVLYVEGSFSLYLPLTCELTSLFFFGAVVASCVTTSRRWTRRQAWTP